MSPFHVERSHKTASGHVETAFPRLGLFIRQFSHLLTKCLMSPTVPGHPAIIVSDSLVASFTGFVSCAFAKTNYLSSNGMVETKNFCGNKQKNMIPLCIVNAFLCCANCFSLRSMFSNCQFSLVSFYLGIVCLFMFCFDFSAVNRYF